MSHNPHAALSRVQSVSAVVPGCVSLFLGAATIRLISAVGKHLKEVDSPAIARARKALIRFALGLLALVIGGIFAVVVTIAPALISYWIALYLTFWMVPLNQVLITQLLRSNKQAVFAGSKSTSSTPI
jgi:hypothetical protein